MKRPETVWAALKRQAPDLLFMLLLGCSVIGFIVVFVSLFSVRDHFRSSLPLPLNRALGESHSGPWIELGFTLGGGLLAILSICLMKRWRLPRPSIGPSRYLMRRWHASWHEGPIEGSRRDFVWNFLIGACTALLALRLVICILADILGR